MIRCLFFMTLAVVMGLRAGAATPADITLHVSPTGDDRHPGTAERPFATLARARDAARALKEKVKAVTVLLHEGIYYLSEPLVVTPRDSGAREAPVTYAGAPGEKAVLSGGVRLNLDWTPYRDGILKASVGKLDFDQLFVDGLPQTLARYPNKRPGQRPFGGTAADAIAPERVRRWSDPAGGFVHGIHKAEWGSLHYRVVGVDEKGHLKLEGGHQNNRRMGLHDRFVFVENVFEELDAPGEWFLDRKKGVLYFMPPQGADLARMRVEAAGIRRLIEFRGTSEDPVRFISIRGLTLTQTARTFMERYEPLLRSDWTIYRGGAVFMEGTEDCAISDVFFDAVGGNAVFVSRYNRRAEITGCKITEAGAGGVCLVGDPGAVRSPCFEYNESIPFEKLDRAPGPKTPNYPAQCRVHDNLIHGIGQIEKQVAGVQISMAEEITVSHNSIYDVPRAGINIGEGAWGGHVIEFNDVFDTVQETGDHGAFNAWGRDRYWQPNQKTEPDAPLWRAMDEIVAKHPDMPRWDAWKTTLLRNNRWRCDHGWDIDLDDGSSNYLITNNLCLSGGIKLREGFSRVVENNVMVNNSLHPHVWFEKSEDRFVRNIVTRNYRPIWMPKVWGKEIDGNLFPDENALENARALGLDQHSVAGDPLFIDPARGDFRVKEGSPALKGGFRNFPMDQFGVLSPKLRKEARAPLFVSQGQSKAGSSRDGQICEWMGALARNDGRRQVGIDVFLVPVKSVAAQFGLQSEDVILEIDGKPVPDLNDFVRLCDRLPAGKRATLKILRGEKRVAIVIEGAR